MSVLTARTPAGRSERSGLASFIPTRQPVSMRLDAHDIASGLPAALQATVQKGLLERLFLDSLRPEFIFPAVCDVMPWAGNTGDSKIWTRAGLMTPSPTPVSPGSDTTAGSYSVEQWSSSLDKYGKSLDTDMLASAVQLANKYAQDVKTLGIHAGQSMNRAARDTLYSAYSGGRTYATASSSSSTTLVVADTNGFGYTSVNGVLTAVSGSNPLTVTVNGVANTVTAVSVASGAGNLTLGTSVSASAGWAVVAANAPASIRPSGVSTLYDFDGTKTATLAQFRSAYTRLKKMNVPTIGGAYTAFVTQDTINELYADTAFTLALTGQIESPVWRDLAIGRINGIDFVPNNEVPTIAGGSAGATTVNRAIVVGEGALVWSPLENLGSLLAGTGVENVPAISMVSPAPSVEVALIVRPPQDRFQNLVTTTWQAVGGYGVPTDLLDASGDPALFKRGVVVSHA